MYVLFPPMLGPVITWNQLSPCTSSQSFGTKSTPSWASTQGCRQPLRTSRPSSGGSTLGLTYCRGAFAATSAKPARASSSPSKAAAPSKSPTKDWATSTTDWTSSRCLLSYSALRRLRSSAASRILLLVNLVPSFRVSRIRYFAWRARRTFFSSFCVMRTHRVRVLFTRCHSSLMDLSMTRPRSPAMVCASLSILSSTSSFWSCRSCRSSLYEGLMRYSSGILSRSMAASMSSSNFVRCAASWATRRGSANLRASPAACRPVWLRTASSIRGSLPEARYSMHRSISVALPRSSFRARRSTSGSPRRCWSLSAPRRMGSSNRASTTSSRPLISSADTRGCLTHAFTSRFPMGVRPLARSP
mmetsp:Transcript_2470/g.6905  ORF Transcript_2470/g.6905 Transcript_2470/m.6905 type:complete len:359 (-) Transcript_2470:936-2012(-)